MRPSRLHGGARPCRDGRPARCGDDPDRLRRARALPGCVALRATGSSIGPRSRRPCGRSPAARMTAMSLLHLRRTGRVAQALVAWRAAGVGSGHGRRRATSTSRSSSSSGMTPPQARGRTRASGETAVGQRTRRPGRDDRCLSETSGSGRSHVTRLSRCPASSDAMCARSWRWLIDMT
jgi:hypothetical protein